MSAKAALDHLVTSSEDRKCFFSKLAFYEEGEQTGRLLAKIAKAQQSGGTIDLLRAGNGRLVTALDSILAELVTFYSSLYQLKQTYGSEDIMSYLNSIRLPKLSEQNQEMLDSPITPEELQEATAVFPNCKAPGDDGYRQISLLQSEIKILAKVLALLLNKVISTIIHPDQSGFMPQKSTAVNLCWLFLNIQAKADNVGTRTLLSLDAAKAFDSVEW